jgi:hypothetical protein
MVSRKHTKTNGFNLRVLWLGLLKGDLVGDICLLYTGDLHSFLVFVFFAHCNEMGGVKEGMEGGREGRKEGEEGEER